MERTHVKHVFLVAFMLLVSMTMLSCSDSDKDKDVDGLIYNQTSYRVTVNFLSLKIVELNSGELLPEGSLEKDTTYLFQVTVLNNAGTALEVIDSALVIDSNTDEHNINGQTCSWFIRISGDNAPFGVVSSS
ncbi:MAG: hypothetical protein GY801_28335 [bacterium]|nr:hypothetical protein [bacterium]